MADLGTDFSGVRDVDAALSTVGGRTALAQAILRRLTNETGLGMPDARNKDYGYDLRETVGTATPTSLVEQRVRSQVMAEEEVEAASVNVTHRRDDALIVEIGLEDSEGPFTLTVQADALTVELLTGESSALV